MDRVPVVQLMIDGGRNTILQVHNSVLHNIPVVIIAGMCDGLFGRTTAIV
jgi:hypothetical protein